MNELNLTPETILPIVTLIYSGLIIDFVWMGGVMSEMTYWTSVFLHVTILIYFVYQIIKNPMKKEKVVNKL